MTPSYDAIVVGTGFASAFFLHGYLARAPASARVLVLERGPRRNHAWQLRGGAERLRRDAEGSFSNRQPEKPWAVTLAFGGGSNTWWACTPRMLPSDFRLRSRYGVGRDWPLAYEDLEAHYCRAEELMGVAGPSDDSPFPRSRPYPQPPHRLNDPERLLKEAHPEHFFPLPAARPSRPLPSGRPACCASGVCGLCPIDSKFTVSNEMGALFADPRVRLETGASVEALDVAAGAARGVVYRQGGREARARGALLALGANGLFNPAILLRSGLDHPLLGRRLFEQAGVLASADLAGVESFQGGSSLSGHGYMLYDGPRRRDRGAVLIETSNVPQLRNERGRWRQVLRMKCIVEDLPRDESRVVLDDADPARPAVHFAGRSAYAERARAALETELADALGALPIERLRVRARFQPTESHVLGTVPMGDDPADSLVDRHLVHHRVRNLLVLGGSAFPVSGPANPSLTIAALSLWAAAKLPGVA